MLTGAGVATPLLLLSISQSTAQSFIQVRINRWLEVQNPTGTVIISRSEKVQPAQAGDRLQAVGDAITTGPKSAVTLAVDTAIGVIVVAENTYLQIETLKTSPNNGQITRLQITKGQARLKLRPFTNPDSRLEIITPAGLSGVRGTEFGVAIQPNGKTGLATLQGSVYAAAQHREVTVPAQFQNFTVPGEPPSRPVPLKNDPTLQYDFEKSIEKGVRKIRLIGQVDPVNSVVVNDVPQSTDRTGKFSAPLLASSYLRVKVVVRTPLGTERSYELALR